jgi:hypothetical protein
MAIPTHRRGSFLRRLIARSSTLVIYNLGYTPLIPSPETDTAIRKELRHGLFRCVSIRGNANLLLGFSWHAEERGMKSGRAVVSVIGKRALPLKAAGMPRFQGDPKRMVKFTSSYEFDIGSQDVSPSINTSVPRLQMRFIHAHPAT